MSSESAKKLPLLDDEESRNRNRRSMNNEGGDGGGFSWLTALGFGFLTFNSGMAIYRSDRDVRSIAFVAGSYVDLVLLFLCLHLFEMTPRDSPRRGWLKAAVRGLSTLLTVMFSQKVKEKTCSSFRVGNLMEAQTIQTLAQQRWPNTFRLDCTLLGQPIGTVTRQLTWEQYLARPMEQPVPGTCAPVACTVCVVAAHRFEHRKLHGEAAVPCYQLIRACFRDGIWTPGKGANVGKVLTKIQEMGGVPATTNAPTPAPCVLTLRSWKEHSLWDWDDGSVAGRLHDRVAELLERHGPCIGVLWVCPWYHRFDADADDTLVYRGCGRNDDDRRISEELYRSQVGWHAVLCFAYRFCGQELHVQVQDNHSATGPRRWIDAEELHTLYTLSSV